ncbi:hypothetical protein CBM2599_A50035 [Cupriavidus taiwanensis]|uniref:Uncharacterized protein n=1 Tax=Cupriavidus taiwanensis TaxID=164546 RepID=A0A976AKA7_9BURK|nr:hypothetical protein CBM2599_A50035 [Cupriavidus taiwanensis]SOY91213.1 hypothetical protein CBM2600_A60035 [Cupriavidus taiwanensis]SPD63867.1 protein of unknown function [Cupriavidus taiwanensis]
MEERVFYRTDAVAPQPPARDCRCAPARAEAQISVAKLMTRAHWSRFAGMETVLSLVACAASIAAASISLSRRTGQHARAVAA